MNASHYLVNLMSPKNILFKYDPDISNFKKPIY